MYTYNYYVFGVDINKTDLSKDIDGIGIEYSKNINGKIWQITFPYHGGLKHPIVIGNVITDDDSDDKSLFLMDIKNSKKEDYIEDYNYFKLCLIEDLEANMGIDDDGYDETAKELISKLNNTEPEFYLVEVSS